MDKLIDALSWWKLRTEFQKKNLAILYFDNKESFELTEADIISIKDKNDFIMPQLIKKLEK